MSKTKLLLARDVHGTLCKQSMCRLSLTRLEDMTPPSSQLPSMLGHEAKIGDRPNPKHSHPTYRNPCQKIRLEDKLAIKCLHQLVQAGTFRDRFLIQPAHSLRITNILLGLVLKAP
jgi:hypothetical protein